MLLVLCLITCTFAASTFAKYISSADSTIEVTVAKWADITVDGSAANDPVDITDASPVYTIDLFAAINDTKLPGGDEGDVVDNKIAPGTTGSVDIVVVNGSEVTIDLTCAIELTTKPNGLTFKVTEKDGAGDTTTASITNVTAGTNKTFTISWEWVYYTDAAGDTNDMSFQSQTLSPVVTITATQVD